MTGRWYVLTGVAACVAVLGLCRGTHKAIPDPGAPMRTDRMIEALRDSGWVVLPAEKVGEVGWKVSDLEADTARLGRQVRTLKQEAAAAGAQVRVLTGLYAQTRADMELHAEAHMDTTAQVGADSLTSTFGDGVFSGRIAFYPRKEAFHLQVVAEIAAALAVTEAPDGRVLFSAAPKDPRVTLRLDQAQWVPPAPVRACTLGQTARAAAVGGLAVQLGRALLVR